jgi:hypothetical protein
LIANVIEFSSLDRSFGTWEFIPAHHQMDPYRKSGPEVTSGNVSTSPFHDEKRMTSYTPLYWTPLINPCSKAKIFKVFKHGGNKFRTSVPHAFPQWGMFKYVKLFYSF